MTTLTKSAELLEREFEVQFRSDLSAFLRHNEMEDILQYEDNPTFLKLLDKARNGDLTVQITTCNYTIANLLNPMIRINEKFRLQPSEMVEHTLFKFTFADVEFYLLLYLTAFSDIDAEITAWIYFQKEDKFYEEDGVLLNSCFGGKFDFMHVREWFIDTIGENGELSLYKYLPMLIPAINASEREATTFISAQREEINKRLNEFDIQSIDYCGNDNLTSIRLKTGFHLEVPFEQILMNFGMHSYSKVVSEKKRFSLNETNSIF